MLVAGLNLVVGFAGQIAIGWVALLTLGAYTTSVLAAGNVMPAFPPYLALAIAAVVGAVFGVIIGLPALRLRTFYFAITTLGFATIVTQVALAWQSVTGGGVGVPGPIFPRPFDPAVGLLLFLLRPRRDLHLDDGEHRGEPVRPRADRDPRCRGRGRSQRHRQARAAGHGVPVQRRGRGVAGGLFASLQSYITPDAFTIDLSVLFFIAILIGGRGSILGPLLGTILLTVLPEFAAPLVAWSTFLYAVLLLVIVLVIPGGIAELLDFKNRRPLESTARSCRARSCCRACSARRADAGALTLDRWR